MLLAGAHNRNFQSCGMEGSSKRKELWGCATFRQVVVDFRTDFRLEEFSFKVIGKFLYVEGGKLFERAKVPTPDADYFVQSAYT